MTDKDLAAVLRLQEKLLDTLLKFHISLLGIRMEVSALKELVLSDEDLKARFAKQLLAEGNTVEPAIQQLRTALQKQLKDVRVLQKDVSKWIQ